MRYMHKKVYFNKFELQELERRNPTLFELAQYVADKAHITATVFGKNSTWVAVAYDNDYTKLLCPSEVFHVPGTNENQYTNLLDTACSELSCWAMHDEPSDNPDKPYRPCWFRTWNDFVADMKGV